MDMAGEKRIAASREDVWRALNDPEVLKASIPGCEELEKVSDTEFTSRITAKVGPIKAKFSGKVELSDINEPVSYRINGEGQGGVAGFAKGGASVFLDADGAEATVLRYQVEANVGGKLAQLGTRLIDSTASKLADKFFEQFSDTVAPTKAADDTPPAETPKAGGFMGKLMGRGKTTAAAPPTPEISAAADAPGLVVTQEGPIALLSFDRPEKRNAMTLAMWRRLAQEVRRLGADDSVRAIVLTGRHGDFCVGADISEFGEVRGTAEQTAAYEQAVEDGGIAIAEAPKPTIAAIEGYCIGGGLGLAVACDFRIAYPDATLFVPSAKMSIVYGVRETQNILVLVGLSQAKRLLFSGARVGAEESRQIGLIDRVARDPLNEARAVANSMAANAPLAIAGSKYILNGLALGKGGLDLERAHELITRASESDDYREGRAAFAERRKPDFKGRCGRSMKPPPFEYVKASTVAEAVAVLAQSDGEAKVIAGGQSLMPMMNFRLLSPSVLVDINGIRDLDYVRIEDGALHVGALTRHHRLETSPTIAEQFPVLRAAMACVAHLAIRNRGTLGGSLSHADPAAELPMMLVLLDGEIRIAGAGGERVVAARDFFLGALTPDLEEDEILVEVRLPLLPRGSGWGFEEFAQRSGDFALAAAAATVTLSQGTVSEARVALMGVDDTPLRLPAGEDLLRGRALDRDLINRVAALARDAVNPNTDLHASADYRRHLAEVLTRRVLGQAWRRVAEEPS